MDMVVLSTEHITDDTWAFHTPHTWRVEYVDDLSRARGRSRLLDARSDPHWLTDLLMHEALRRLMLTSDGHAMPLREQVTSSRTQTTVPSSTVAAELDRLWDLYTGAWTHRKRLAAVKEAQDTVLRLQFAPDRSKVRGTQEWKDALASDPRPLRIVASVFGVSHQTVANYRRKRR